MKVRKAALSDAKECLKMRAREEKIWSAIDFVSSVRNKHCIFLVAEKKERIVGYCIGFIVPTQKKESMLHETRVDKPERGNGIGKQLVDAFSKEAFGRGVDAINAQIEPKHAKFYCEKCEFKKNAKWIEIKRVPNIMDFAGAWKITDKEAEKMKKGLRRAWKMRKFKSLNLS